MIAILFLIYPYAHSPLYNQQSGAEAVWPAMLFVLYEPVCNRYFTTLGQLVMRFRVRMVKDYRLVPVWRGLVRVVTKYVLGVIAFIRTPVQRQRRAFHDILSGTIAIDSRGAHLVAADLITTPESSRS